MQKPIFIGGLHAEQPVHSSFSHRKLSFGPGCASNGFVLHPCSGQFQRMAPRYITQDFVRCVRLPARTRTLVFGHSSAPTSFEGTAWANLPLLNSPSFGADASCVKSERRRVFFRRSSRQASKSHRAEGFSPRKTPRKNPRMPRKNPSITPPRRIGCLSWRRHMSCDEKMPGLALLRSRA